MVILYRFDCNRQLWVVLYGKSSQQYLVNAGVPQGSIYSTTHFLLYINDLPEGFICNITIYGDITTVCSKCDQASDLSQQLQLVSELQFDLQDIVECDSKWLVDFIALFVLMWKWIGLFLRKNHLLRCQGWLSLLNWVGTLTLSLLFKLSPRKLQPWFVLWSFCLLRLLYISIILRNNHAWSTVAMFGLVLLVATLNW